MEKIFLSEYTMIFCVVLIVCLFFAANNYFHPSCGQAIMVYTIWLVAIFLLAFLVSISKLLICFFNGVAITDFEKIINGTTFLVILSAVIYVVFYFKAESIMYKLRELKELNDICYEPPTRSMHSKN